MNIVTVMDLGEMLRRQEPPYHLMDQTHPLLNIPHNQDGEDPSAVCLYGVVLLFHRAVVDGASGIARPGKERQRCIIGFDNHERKSNHRWLGGEFMQRIVSLVGTMPTTCIVNRVTFDSSARTLIKCRRRRTDTPTQSLYRATA
jgi:hypothetical protein